MLALPREIWKDIPGFEGYYQQSTEGRTRSLKRVVQQSNNRTTTVPERILKPKIGKNNYCSVTLVKNGVYSYYLVHFLTLLTFVGPRPLDKPQINHKDENPLNNSLWNLEYCTANYNINFGNRSKLVSERLKGRDNAWMAKKVCCYDRNGSVLGTFSSYSKAERELGLAGGTVTRCIQSNKPAKGFYFKEL